MYIGSFDNVVKGMMFNVAPLSNKTFSKIYPLHVMVMCKAFVLPLSFDGISSSLKEMKLSMIFPTSQFSLSVKMSFIMFAWFSTFKKAFGCGFQFKNKDRMEIKVYYCFNCFITLNYYA